MRKTKAAKAKVPDRRPWKTTANPNWAYAENPVDLIPATDDPHGRGELMVRLVGSAIITQGPAAGQRFSEVMLPWQRELVRYIFGETDKHGRRIVQRVGLLLGKGPLALDTPIATPTGWTTMGALTVGDQVFAQDGTPTRVTNVSDVFTGRDCYRITFSDGTSIVADAEHRWPVKQRRVGADFGDDAVATNTAEIFKGYQENILFIVGPNSIHSIVNVELVESVPTKCITIEHESHVFLAGEGLVPTCNSGKTSFAAAIAQAVIMDSYFRKTNARGLVVILAANIPSAGIAFQALQESIASDAELVPQFRTYTARRAIRHLPTAIECRVISPELQNSVGLRPILTIADEIHVAAEANKDFSAVIDQLRRGSANWGSEALEIGITTAPADRSVGFYAEWSNEMRAVRDGKREDNTTLPVLYTWPTQREDISIDDRNQWWRGMPSLRMKEGDKGTMDAEMLLRELRQAQQDEGGRSLELLLSQRMNIEPAERKVTTKTGMKDNWRACALMHGVPRAETVTKAAVAFDPSSGSDDCFAVAIARMDLDGIVSIQCKQFLTAEGMQRVPSSLRSIYDAAARAGELFVFNKYPEMEQAILSAAEEVVAECGAVWGGDRFGMAGFAARAEARLGGKFVDVSQGWKLASSLAEVEALMSGEVFEHEGHPLLSWNVENLVLDNSGSVPRFKKADAGLSGQGALKIDGIMATLSAIQLLSQVQSFDVSSMIAPSNVGPRW
jgi:phage terminase large subunit-like protein